jgi:hypothetical protein
MKWRVFVAFLALAAAACSSNPDGPRAGVGLPLACEAASARVCPLGGCTSSNPGYQHQGAISLTIPGFSEYGRFCSGSACEDARFVRIEGRGDGRWTAEVSTGQGWVKPEGEVEVSRDRQNFRLVRMASDGSTTWSGYCRAAGS